MQPEQRIFVVRNERHRRYAADHILTLPPPFEVHTKPCLPGRTLQQNARLWLLHTEAARVTGYSSEEMHEFALCRHFGSREILCGDIARVVPLRRSSTRNIAEFTEFMEATEAWYGTTFGVWLLDGEVLTSDRRSQT